MEQELESFEFAVDRKTTVWERTRFSIEAESLEQAKEILRNASYEEREALVSSDYFECETLHETSEYMTPEENDGQATEEWISYEDSEQIINNATKED